MYSRESSLGISLVLYKKGDFLSVFLIFFIDTDLSNSSAVRLSNSL